MSTLTGYIAIAKDLLSLLRDFLIFALVILLLCFPATLKNRLIDAGIREGEFMGMKFTAEEIDKTNTTLNESQVAITNLQKQLDSANHLLTEAQTKIADPVLKAEISKAEVESTNLIASTNMIQRTVKQTLAANAPKVIMAQETVNANRKWGVVYGADASLEKAKYEVGPIARKLRLPKASIYLRQDAYRSVVVVDDRSEAEQLLTVVRQRRPDAYIVTMNTWCPGAESGDGYINCK